MSPNRPYGAIDAITHSLIRALLQVSLLVWTSTRAYTGQIKEFSPVMGVIQGKTYLILHIYDLRRAGDCHSDTLIFVSRN